MSETYFGIDFSLFDCDKYQLKENERLSEDGNTITCTVCGDTKKIKRWSEVRQCYTWELNITEEHPWACECVKKRKQEEALREERERFERVYNSRACRSWIGTLYENAAFDKLRASSSATYNKAKETCERFVEKSDYCKQNGFGIYLWSKSAGTGKSTLMACTRRALVAKGEKCLMINSTDYLDYVKNDRETVENGVLIFNASIFKRVDILILDDIGTLNLSRGSDNYTSWAESELYSLIEARNRNGLSTLFTSNYSPKDLQTERGYDFKLVDRILSRSSAVIEVTGTSFRGGNRI